VSGLRLTAHGYPNPEIESHETTNLSETNPLLPAPVRFVRGVHVGSWAVTGNWKPALSRPERSERVSCLATAAKPRCAQSEYSLRILL
jgi:hypothetical protein